MRQSVASLIVGLFVTGVVYAQGQVVGGSDALTGEWVVKVVNYTETLPLNLKVVESRVSGSYRGAPIVGEVTKGQIVFANPKNWAEYRAGTIGRDSATDQYSTVYFARLNETGELEGTADVYIRGAQAVQKMTWSARRAQGR